MLFTNHSRLFVGLNVLENCAISGVKSNKGKVCLVETSNQGDFECDYFVNCGGFWAREIGKLSQPAVKVPLHSTEHYYLHTKPIEGINPNLPGMFISFTITDGLYYDIFVTQYYHICT